MRRGSVQDAGHALALIDLKVGIGQQFGGFARPVWMTRPGEASGGLDAVPVGVGG
jgi:hypothetical protein